MCARLYYMCCCVSRRHLARFQCSHVPTQCIVDGTQRMALTSPRLLSPDQFVSSPRTTHSQSSAAAAAAVTNSSSTSTTGSNSVNSTPPVLQQQHSTPTVLLNGFNTHFVNHQVGRVNKHYLHSPLFSPITSPITSPYLSLSNSLTLSRYRSPSNVT